MSEAPHDLIRRARLERVGRLCVSCGERKGLAFFRDEENTCKDCLNYRRRAR